jgi:neutral trehalase
MVDEYVRTTNDWSFVRENFEFMEKEFNYWMQEHMITVKHDNKAYKLARFNCEDAGPRPESYLEDFEVRHITGNQNI